MHAPGAKPDPDAIAGARRSWLAMLRIYVPAIAATNLAWEFLHLPLYTIWTERGLGYNVFAVVHCTAGDVLIAMATLVFALVATGTKDWPDSGFWPVTWLATVLGVAYTVYSEWLNTGIRLAWAYSEWMPVVPGLGVGLSPLAQWIVLPPLILWWCRRYLHRPRR